MADFLDLDESISGSDSESEDDDAFFDTDKSKDTTLSVLLKKQAKLSDTKAEADTAAPTNRKTSSGKPPLMWFTSPILPSNVSLGIYRAIITNIEQENSAAAVEIIRKSQVAPTPPMKNAASSNKNTPPAASGPHIFLCMMGGGHFAGMVVSLTPKFVKNHVSGHERQATVLTHKTFHRYTTRRKQGGGQSANDAAKGAAHSAGSSLRRYNEAALTNEVRELLSEWKHLIDSAQLLFIRATGTTNRRTLFGPYENQVMRLNDPRLRSFPFTTRRATQAELMRSFVELTRVKISTVDEAALRDGTTQATTAPTKPVKPTPPALVKLSKEEELAMKHTTQLQSLIRRTKLPAILSYLSSNSLSPDFQFFPPTSQQNHHTPTLLHLAASINASAIVLGLLENASANPTLQNGEGKTAFDLAGDRITRDAFRVARHKLGEEVFDWEGANIPAPLSKAEAEKRGDRDRKDAEIKEAERRKAEMMRLKLEEKSSANQQAKRAGGKALGVGSVEKTAQEKREEESKGMTPEMRARLERERRARAAEERIRRMQGGD